MGIMSPPLYQGTRYPMEIINSYAWCTASFPEAEFVTGSTTAPWRLADRIWPRPSQGRGRRLAWSWGVVIAVRLSSSGRTAIFLPSHSVPVRDLGWSGRPERWCGLFGIWPSWWSGVIQLVGGTSVAVTLEIRIVVLICSGSMTYT